jgi:hypothetical protein
MVRDFTAASLLGGRFQIVEKLVVVTVSFNTGNSNHPQRTSCAKMWATRASTAAPMATIQSRLSNESLCDFSRSRGFVVRLIAPTEPAVVCEKLYRDAESGKIFAIEID